MKKLISVLLAILMLVSASICAGSLLLGDVDSNGVITAADARRILRFAAALDVPGEKEKEAADVNRDSKITASDARTVLRVAASLEEPVTAHEMESFSAVHSTQTEEKTAYEVYNTACSFTCQLYTFTPEGSANTSGTGFFISSDGVMVTNCHVLYGAATATAVLMNGESCNVTQVLGFDAAKDIAILKTDAENVPFALFSQGVKEGDTVYAMGNPKGYTGTFTAGNVSFSGRVVEEMNNSVEYIQFSAPVSDGNSGGPLLDTTGSVAGIVAMSNEAGQNLNFAIPVTEIEKIDISSPCTIADVKPYEQTKSVAFSISGITVRMGGCAVVYAIAGSDGEYNLNCVSDNDSVRAFCGRSYGNVNVIYITGVKKGSANVKVYFEGNENICDTIFVSVNNQSKDVYYGIPGGIPDFGALNGIAPGLCYEDTDGNASAYSFLYSVNEIEKNNINVQSAMEEYIEALAENGYTLSSTADNNQSAEFLKKDKNIRLAFGILEYTDGNWYVFVLIYK